MTSPNRCQTALQALCAVYPFDAWLIAYYPLFYFSKVIKQYPEWSSVREGGSSFDCFLSDGNAQTFFFDYDLITKQVLIPLMLLGPLSYTFLLRYHFFEGKVGKGALPAEDSPDFKDISYYDVVNVAPEAELQMDVDNGLSEEEVLKRQRKYGRNEIVTRRDWLNTFRRLVLGSSNLLLETAAILAAFLQDWLDMTFACCLLAWNLYNNVHAIRQYDDIASTMVGDLSGSHDTLRGGTILPVDSRELVPGDIIHIQKGQCVMADARVVSSDDSLGIDQSSITGESTKIKKYNGGTCYSGTGVLDGSATLIVVATGYHTFVGRTLKMIKNPMPSRAELQAANVLPTYIRDYHEVLRSVGIALGSLFMLGSTGRIINNTESSYLNPELAVAIAILINPVSLNLNIGRLRADSVLRLSETGALISRQESLSAECLASIDIICSDKTGTLTGNNLSIGDPYCVSSNAEAVFLTACLSNSPNRDNLDPIEEAILRESEHYPRIQESLGRYKVTEYKPFDPETKRISARVESPDGHSMLCTKGAPKAVLELCSVNSDVEEAYKAKAAQFASQGYRSLGIARKQDDKEWELLGLLPMSDPPREDTISAISTAKKLGVTVKMLTGDAVSIAQSFASKIDIGNTVLEASSCGDDDELQSPEKLTATESADTFAEVFPENKKRIVQLLQSRGHHVAVTGDGVMDALSLATADCGIAVNGATELAMAASDIQMQTPGLAAMVHALQISRQTLRLVSTYLGYRITLTLHLLITILANSTIYGYRPNIYLLLLYNQFSDVIGIMLALHPQDTPIRTKPDRWSTGRLMKSAVPTALIFAIGTWLIPSTLPNEVQTANASATRDQIIFLHALLSNHWPFLISRVDSRLQFQIHDWRSIITLVSFGVLATLLCSLGWIGDGQRMGLGVVIRVWLYSFATVCTATSLRVLLLDEELCSVESH